MKMGINYLLCKLRGHKVPYMIEAWDNKQGNKKSFYICRRCLTAVGEKYYV